LVGRITSGHWKPGDALPNEAELSQEFGLSPGTIRKALEWMESARLIVRQQGRGTFVRDPSSEEFVNWYERLRNEDGAPIHDKVETLDIAEDAANDEECFRLHLSGGARVRRTNRNKIEGGSPYMIERSSVPCALFPLPEGEQQKDT
jgi:GntR family transcriptional regulator